LFVFIFARERSGKHGIIGLFQYKGATIMIQVATSPHVEQSDDGETLLALESGAQFERVWHDIFNAMQPEILREQVERMQGQQEWKWLFER
jgi:hypothetical protein